MKVDPSNNQMKNGYEQLLRDKAAAETGPRMGASGGPSGGDMFGGPEAEQKLRADPNTSKFFDDPQF